MTALRFLTAAVCAFFFCGLPLRANDAGGGTPGRGAPVTLTTDATTATLDNGLIRAVIDKPSGRISRYQFAGTDMVDPANPIYYSFDGGPSYEQPSGCVFTVVNQSADSIEVSCKRTWKPGAGYKHAFDIDLRYVLRRGDTGVYAFATLDLPPPTPRPATANGASSGNSLATKPRSSSSAPTWTSFAIGKCRPSSTKKNPHPPPSKKSSNSTPASAPISTTANIPTPPVTSTSAPGATRAT